MPRWLAKLLNIEWTPLRLALLAVLSFVPALWQGYFADDHLHQWVLHAGDRGGANAPRWWADLFRFIDADAGYSNPIHAAEVLPWFADPQLRVAFARPVSAATLWLDHQLFPDNAAWAHAHSLAWLGLAVGLGAWAYRRLGLDPRAAALAGLCFAVDDAHAYAATWIANRSTAVAVVFALLALLAHCRAREQGRRVACLSVPLLLLALLAKESGLVALAWIAAWELHLGPSTDESGAAPASVSATLRRLPSMALALLPSLAAFVAWRWFYVNGGYGAEGSGMYVDPGDAPFEFVLTCLERIPQLLLALLTPAPVEVAVIARPIELGLIGLGVALGLGLARWLLPAWRGDPRVRMFVTATLLSLVPVCGAPPAARLLMFAGFPLFGALALAMLGDSDEGEPEAAWTWFPRALLFLLVPLSALLCPLQAGSIAPLADAMYASVGRHVEDHPECRDRDIILINGADMVVAGGAIELVTQREAAAGRVEGLTHPSVTYLGSSFGPLEVERAGPSSLELRSERGWLATGIERLTAAEPPPVGEPRAHRRFVATVLEANAEGRPVRVRFDFDAELDALDLCWVKSVDGGLAPATLPADGEVLELAPSFPR